MRRSFLAVSVAGGALVLGGLAAAVPAASAAVVPVAGCPFHLGPITGGAGLGTEYSGVAVLPVSPAESCTTTVTVTVVVAPLAPGLSYGNILGNPLSTARTLTFTPGRLAPVVEVGWDHFACADPAVPGTLTFVVGGQRASTGVDPETCVGISVPPDSSLASVSSPSVSVVSLAPTVSGHGYWAVDQFGNVTAKGDAVAATPTAFPTDVVAMGAATGGGYWVVGCLLYTSPSPRD